MIVTGEGMQWKEFLVYYYQLLCKLFNLEKNNNNKNNIQHFLHYVVEPLFGMQNVEVFLQLYFVRVFKWASKWWINTV